MALVGDEDPSDVRTRHIGLNGTAVHVTRAEHKGAYSRGHFARDHFGADLLSRRERQKM